MTDLPKLKYDHKYLIKLTDESECIVGYFRNFRHSFGDETDEATFYVHTSVGGASRIAVLTVHISCIGEEVK